MAVDPALTKCMKTGKSYAECKKEIPPRAVPKPVKKKKGK